MLNKAQDWVSALEGLSISRPDQKQTVTIKLDEEGSGKGQQSHLELRYLALELSEILFHLVSGADPADSRQLLSEIKAGIDPLLLANHEKGSKRVMGLFDRLKSDLMQKSQRIAAQIDSPNLMEKVPMNIRPEDYNTLDELWSVCTMEDASRAGDGHSEAKTMDMIEISEEGNSRSKAISLINVVFEAWQASRKDISTLIEKKQPKLLSLIEEASLKEEVKILFWGKERETLLSKMKQGKPKSEDKSLLENFYKKQIIPESHHKALVDAVSKQLIDKYRIDHNSKLEKYIPGLSSDLQEILKLLPRSELAEGVISQLEAHYRPVIEKKMLAELDTALAAVVTHFKNYKTQLDKSPPAEGFMPAETEYAWSDKPADKCAYSKAADMRQALTNGFRDVIDLDFPKANTKQVKPVSLKAWEAHYSPVQLVNMNHAKAVDSFIKSNVKPIRESGLWRVGVDFGAKKVVYQLYRSSLKLTLKLFSVVSPEDKRNTEDYQYLLISLDALQQVFVKHDLRPYLTGYEFVYMSHKRKLLRELRRHTISRLTSVLQSTLFEQDWMDFHRFSRAKKPGSPIDSVECEGLHASWLMLFSKMRGLSNDYLIRGVDPCLGLVPCCYLIADYFFEVYSIFASTPVSVQRTELFVNDLKLCIGFLESVYFLFSNTPSTQQPDGRVAFKVLWPHRGMVDAIDFIVLSKKVQLIKAHLKVMYKILTLNNSNIDDYLKELQGGLYKNRKLLASFPEIYRKAFEMLDFLAKENENIKDLMQEIGQPLFTETPLSDSHRLFDTQGSLGNLKSRPVENKMADIEAFGNSTSVANDLLESNVAFTVSLEYITDSEDRWLVKVEKFLRDLTEPPLKLVEEFHQQCKIGKKEVILSQEESDLVIFSKKRDYFFNRPELLDKDSELSPMALATKNKLRQLF